LYELELSVYYFEKGKGVRIEHSRGNVQEMFQTFELGSMSKTF
jgi:hypothetical protein